MTTENKNLWWGYLHINGHIQAKRYLGKLTIEDAKRSPFVQKAFGPFKARDRDEAIQILSNNL